MASYISQLKDLKKQKTLNKMRFQLIWQNFLSSRPHMIHTLQKHQVYDTPFPVSSFSLEASGRFRVCHVVVSAWHSSSAHCI